jgi:hypothetical protein
VVWHGGVLNLKTCAPPIKPIMECWYRPISQATVELKSNVSLISRRAVSHIWKVQSHSTLNGERRFNPSRWCSQVSVKPFFLCSEGERQVRSTVHTSILWYCIRSRAREVTDTKYGLLDQIMNYLFTGRTDEPELSAPTASSSRPRPLRKPSHR